MPEQLQPAGQQLDASYPAPPDYFTLFTDANMTSLASTDTGAAQADSELKFLVPPPPPSSGTYSVFGRTWQVHDRMPTLAEQNIPQLYSEGPIDRITELKRLNHLILFEFLDLVDVLIKDPSQFGARTERIRDIFVNAHHLINEYRGHQAKETLKSMLQQQIESKRASAKATLDKCRELEAVVVQLRQEAAAAAAANSCVLDKGKGVDGATALHASSEERNVPRPDSSLDLQSTIVAAGHQGIMDAVLDTC
ncbi:Mediator of RNA polymerase II transcription subunit 7 [Coemansia thaxteri]|uniref:Mediator of RNA polymerase II transcription subunit 7 n=1 Tax=Coemansia thaxteri TaxID=2663907 RepID=A0A9W8EDW9_9FUNG|nr:Mediator of RNA polymerase II transcription subunit 7 [Coemansia thaxteri]KAJ2009249.1 Mediator of RNA polymerase II transcription subunit 7 [Coemansia thaxteri]KAJ2474162.1 Mediator of RNA polymerase II transcription subunit 7 [Coemansia sp. RSA 2322]KAJ2477643.1 Mediator of RNA polymerase II transcription subunit 7 [Coemansia sp. RSA 2320]